MLTSILCKTLQQHSLCSSLSDLLLTDLRITHGLWSKHLRGCIQLKSFQTSKHSTTEDKPSHTTLTALNQLQARWGHWSFRALQHTEHQMNCSKINNDTLVGVGGNGSIEHPWLANRNIVFPKNVFDVRWWYDLFWISSGSPPRHNIVSWSPLATCSSLHHI